MVLLFNPILGGGGGGVHFASSILASGDRIDQHVRLWS